MQTSNLLTLAEACEFLKISTPTFNKLREELEIQEYHGHRRLIRFDKSELILKVLVKHPTTLALADLKFGNQNSRIKDIMFDDTTFDLRAVNTIDPYGALSLLAEVKALAKEKKIVNFILSKNFATRYLNAIGFFRELKRNFGELVVWDDVLLKSLDPTDEILFPFKLIGYKGQDKAATEELARILQEQGFSEDIAGYIGWILGELSDNSLTHSGGPCYLLAARYPGEKNYLQIGVLDSGVGIQNALRKNDKYSGLSDESALLTAFKRFVSSWPDDAERGKGLTDVVNIARSNRSLFKVDSCDLSLSWDFSDLRKNVAFVEPMTKAAGVRFCFMLIDSDFELEDVNEINDFLSEEIGKLK